MHKEQRWGALEGYERAWDAHSKARWAHWPVNVLRKTEGPKYNSNRAAVPKEELLHRRSCSFNLRDIWYGKQDPILIRQLCRLHENRSKENYWRSLRSRKTRRISTFTSSKPIRLFFTIYRLVLWYSAPVTKPLIRPKRWIYPLIIVRRWVLHTEVRQAN